MVPLVLKSQITSISVRASPDTTENTANSVMLEFKTFLLIFQILKSIFIRKQMSMNAL